MFRLLSFLLYLFMVFPAFGFPDSLRTNISFYAETYYLTANKQGGQTEKDPIFYNHTTLEKFDLNLGLVEFSAKKDHWTFKSGLMLGTYARKNLSQEAQVWRYVNQINISYRLNAKHNFQVGIFPSHIGIESAKNLENFSLSRSYIAENSPYYETGLRWEFNRSENLQFGILALSGWQQISRFNPAIGTQIVFQNKRKWKLNANSFIGNQGNGIRLFHNFFMQIPLTSKIQLVLCEDIGAQLNRFWHGGALFLSAEVLPHLRVSGRWEYYADPQAVIFTKSFSDYAKSITMDYCISNNLLIRSELKNSILFGNEFLSSLVINIP